MAPRGLPMAAGVVGVLLLLVGAAWVPGGQARVHHRSAQQGFHPAKLGEHDELRLLLRSNPSTGYAWEALYDRKVLAKKAEVCTTPSEEGRVGQPCDLQMWFVGRAVNRHTNVTLRYRRPWEKAASPLRTVTIAVTSLRPYRGTRRVGGLASPSPSSAPQRPQGGPALRSRVIQRAQAANIPMVYDPRGLPGFPPVKNQASCGSCWAFATVGMLEVIQAKVFQTTYTLSEQYLVSCDNNYNFGCDGGWFSHTFHHNLAKTAEPRAGAVLDSSFPYTAYDSRTGTPCVSPHPHVMRLSSGEVVSPADPSTLMQLLYQHHAIGVYMNAGCTSFGYASHGILGTLTGGYNHATALVGYNALSNPPYWILRNSWSEGWGDNGYGYFTMSSTMFHYNYVGFEACPVQILDPSGHGLGDVYDPIYGPGVSAGMPHYKGRATATFLYPLATTGGKVWCLSPTLGSTDCKAYYTDNALTADMISSVINVRDGTGLFSADPAAAILCYVCSVQISDCTLLPVNAVYEPKGTSQGRPYYRSPSGLVLFYQSQMSETQMFTSSERWCVGSALGTCDKGYFVESSIAPALSADKIADRIFRYPDGSGWLATISCSGTYNVLPAAPTCVSFGSPCPQGKVLTYYSNKVCSGTPCTSADCCIPAPSCGAGFPCPSGSVAADPSTACTSAVCSPEECCVEACGVWKQCSSCVTDPNCLWCPGTSSCVAASLASSPTCTNNASAIAGCNLPGMAYIGCFSDADLPDLGHATALAPATPQTCAAVCRASGYLFAGVQTPFPQWQPQCFCGNSYGTYGSSSYCTSPCAADPSQICGGIFANSVYYIGATPVRPTCGSTGYLCPSGYTAVDPSTECLQAPCTQAECCSGSSSTCTDLGDPSLPLYISGDYTCFRGTNYVCQNSHFVPVGSCESNLVDCSRLGTRCAASWSSDLQQSLIYCGRDGNLHSAVSLCYAVDATQYCDNNRGGSNTNWVMRTGSAPLRGFVCPDN